MQLAFAISYIIGVDKQENKIKQLQQQTKTKMQNTLLLSISFNTSLVAQKNRLIDWQVCGTAEASSTMRELMGRLLFWYLV